MPFSLEINSIKKLLMWRGESLGNSDFIVAQAQLFAENQQQTENS